MSDGISDAYRSSNAAEQFRKKWEKAQFEEILLTDLRKELVPLSAEQLMYKAYLESEYLRVRHEGGWIIKREWGEFFSRSISTAEEPHYPHVKRYTVEVAGHFGEFSNYDLKEALTDAVLYSRWLKTPEGKEAMEDYVND